MQKMSEKEAIERIKQTPLMRYESEYAKTSELGQSLRMAISALEEIQQYRQLKEQGKILILPCPIGTTVYDIKWWDEKEESVVVGGNRYFRRIRKHKISKSSFSYFDIDSFGETVFLTKEEAEAALEKMKGEEHE